MLPEALAPRLADLEREFADCEARLADPEVVGDQRRYVEISRRYSELRPIVELTAELVDAYRGQGGFVLGYG